MNPVRDGNPIARRRHKAPDMKEPGPGGSQCHSGVEPAKNYVVSTDQQIHEESNVPSISDLGRPCVIGRRGNRDRLCLKT